MIQGLRTIIYPVNDIAAAKAWYQRLLGQDPYFDEPFYVGFEVGGFELGLHPGSPVATGPGGQVAYWGVARVTDALDRVRDLGTVSEISDVGDGILMATVTDPFGNLVGLIENPHFDHAKVR